MKQGKKMFNCILVFSLTVMSFFLWIGQHNIYATENAVSVNVLTEDQLLDEIKNRGVLRVGTTTGWPPYEFNILEDGENKVVGMDRYLSQYIADELGVKLEFVNLDFDSLFSALETGRVDMLAAALNETEERAKTVDFSNTYYTEGQGLLIRFGDEDKIKDAATFDNQGLRIGVYAGTTQEQLVREYMPNSSVTSMRALADLVSALQADQIDGILLDETVTEAYAAEQSDLLSIDAQLPNTDADKKLVIPKNQESFKEFVNKCIQTVVSNDKMSEWKERSLQLIKENQETSWLGYWPYFWNGVTTTVVISFIAAIAGSIIGLVVTLIRLGHSKWLSIVARSYVQFLRGTPMMIQVLFLFFAGGALFGWSPLTSGIVAVTLNSSAYISEVFRGGLNAVPLGQSEAARSLGLNYPTVLRKVIIPQSLRAILPSLGNEWIVIIKESSIVSVIGVAELTFQTRSVTSLTYQGMIPLSISMLIYFILTFTLSKLIRYWEKKINKKYI